MKKSELIRCPMCGGVDLDIYEDTRNAFHQSLRGIEAIHRDLEYVRVYCYCVECSRRWVQYGLTVSQFAGQPVTDEEAS